MSENVWGSNPIKTVHEGMRTSKHQLRARVAYVVTTLFATIPEALHLAGEMGNEAHVAAMAGLVFGLIVGLNEQRRGDQMNNAYMDDIYGNPHNPNPIR